MADLKSKRLIVLKGVLFLVIALTAAVLLLIEYPSWKVAAPLAVLVWAACRFYYFLFYVLERYVDPTRRYAGIWALLQTIWRGRA